MSFALAGSVNQQSDNSIFPTLCALSSGTPTTAWGDNATSCVASTACKDGQPKQISIVEQKFESLHFCPSTSQLSNRSYWPFQLTGIDEDSCGETTAMMDTWDTSAMHHFPSLNEPALTNLCAVPAGLCYILHDMPNIEGAEEISPTVCVSCSTSGCNYNGPLHQICLQHWNTCCELKCRMVAASTHKEPNVLFTDATGGQSVDENPTDNSSLFETLFNLYRCPRCGQCSLSRNTVNNYVATNTPEDRFQNVLNALHYATQQLNDSTSTPVFCPDTHGQPATTVQSSSIFPHSPTQDFAESCDPSGETKPLSAKYGAQRASWGTVWPKSLACPGSFTPLQINQQTQLMRLICVEMLVTLGRITVYHPDELSGPNCELPSARQYHPMPSRQSIKQPVHPDDNRPNFETNVPQGNGGHMGRRHSSVSSNGRNWSFWPTDSCKSKAAGSLESDRRKVVNRKGNIFQPRLDFKVFEKLPAHKRNAYFVHMDDDSCTGNEDTRAFLLAQLTNHRVSEVNCLACHRLLTVYDHFPVIDGIFFISPICHRSAKVTGLRITWHTNAVAPIPSQAEMPGANVDPGQWASNEQGQRLLGASTPVVPPPGCLGPRQQVNIGHLSDQNGVPSRQHGHSARQDRYLHALCMDCVDDTDSADGGRIRCRTCGRPWSGARLLLGGLYTYDVFAAMPCCSAHLTCNSCGGGLNNSGPSIANMDSATRGSNTYVTQESKVWEESVCQSGQIEQGVVRSRDGTLPLNSIAFPFPFFSQYSQLVTCPFCSKADYHFVKPFDVHYESFIPV
ncbi:hypothetical protein P879_00488 [Paragonimus westermani]|uniref:Headcase middle domain-containing protein n=1 Tax=Paragonimus westermani TaxID=34504 RepID=A0A8T0DNM9_9TREM|nr:hypothetical protein P879_00488 [Paragonimus westermani]